MKTIIIEPLDKKKVVDLNSTLFTERDDDNKSDDIDYHQIYFKGREDLTIFLVNSYYMTAQQLKEYVISNHLKVVEAT